MKYKYLFIILLFLIFLLFLVNSSVFAAVYIPPTDTGISPYLLTSTPTVVEVNEDEQYTIYEYDAYTMYYSSDNVGGRYSGQYKLPFSMDNADKYVIVVGVPGDVYYIRITDGSDVMYWNYPVSYCYASTSKCGSYGSSPNCTGIECFKYNVDTYSWDSCDASQKFSDIYPNGSSNASLRGYLYGFLDFNGILQYSGDFDIRYQTYYQYGNSSGSITNYRWSTAYIPSIESIDGGVSDNNVNIWMGSFHNFKYSDDDATQYINYNNASMSISVHNITLDTYQYVTVDMSNVTDEHYYSIPFNTLFREGLYFSVSYEYEIVIRCSVYADVYDTSITDKPFRSYYTYSCCYGLTVNYSEYGKRFFI